MAAHSDPAGDSAVLPRPLAGRGGHFVRLIGIGVGQAVAAIGFALLVQRGFDTLLGGGAAPGPGGAVISPPILVVGLVLCVAVSGWFRGAERTSSERFGQHYVTEVRGVLFEHLTRVPARSLGERNRGGLLMKFVGDLTALRLWVGRGLARLTVAGVAIGLALIALTVINPALGLAVGAVLLVGGASTLVITPWLLRTARASRRRRSRLTGEVAERLSQVAVLQAAGQERRESRRVARRSARVASAMVDQARASGAARAVAEGAGVAAAAAALLVGALEAGAGRASAGTVVAAVGIAGLLAGHLRDLGRVAEYAARARVARAAIRRFLAIPPMPVVPGAPDIAVTSGLVELRDVTVGTALRDITVRAMPGERIAILGPNGAGKSTLTAVLARLVDPDGGSVLIDGQDLRRCSLPSVRRAIGIASPSMPLLSGSMRRNVTYRMPRVDDDELARISALCDLDQLAASLPNGWDTEVGPGGSRLSAGQQARICLARAALGRPALLVLDEADAHLDAEHVQVIERILAEHSGTALVVTHRDDVVRAADRIWLLDSGQLVETSLVPARAAGPVWP